MKDEQDKNKLVVDEFAADIVRDMFQWKLEGVSPQDIANTLNRLGVLSPMEYKRSLGMKFTTPFKTNPKAVWSAATVIRILKNPVYTGVLIQGKATTPSYKVHKRVTKAESEWCVIENNHEAIVSQMLFDNVQKVLRLDTRRSPEDEAVTLFSGMVFCGDCGASMVRKTVPAGGRKYVYYVCSANKQDKTACSPHRIRDNALEEIVLDSLKVHIQDVIDMSDLLAMTDTAPLRTAEAQKIQRQLDKKREEYAMELSNGKNRIYTCRSVGLGTGYGCTSEGIPQSDIHDAVITLIRTYAQYSVDLERLQSLQNERRRATQKQVKKDLAVLQSRRAQLEKAMQDLYEKLIDGSISRESYLSQKQSINIQMQELEEQTAAMQSAAREPDANGQSILEKYREYAQLQELTADIAKELVRNVVVYPGGRLDINLNYRDELEAMLKEAEAPIDAP